jgi:hypothetical protein
MDDETRWQQVRELWQRAERSVREGWQGKTTVSEHRLPRPWTNVLPIAITGTRSAGKTMLYRTLAGLAPAHSEMSKQAEAHRVRISMEGKVGRATVVVIPGQTKTEIESASVSAIFDHTLDRYPTGVIHVVTGGFDRPWREQERKPMVDRLRRRMDGLRAEIEEHRRRFDEITSEIAQLRAESRGFVGQSLAHMKMIKRGMDAKSIQRRLDDLRVRLDDEHGNLLELYRETELEAFSTTCERLEATWPMVDRMRRAHDLWFIVAVAKADLFWRTRRHQMREYYLPQPNGKSSDFGNRLILLANRTNLNRVAVVPISSGLFGYGHDGVDDVEPQMNQTQILDLRAHFLDLLGEFNALRLR